MPKKKSILCIIMVLLAAGIFLSNGISDDLSALAPPSMFQGSFPEEGSLEFKRSPLADMKFLTATFSIAAHFLIDNKKKKILPKIIRDEFRNKKEFLQGIDVEDSYRRGNIVHIPYRADGKHYEIKICLREEFTFLDKSDSEWAVSTRFGIEVVRLEDEVQKIVKGPDADKLLEEKEVMAALHRLNTELLPPVESGKTLWHVISEEILPIKIRDDFKRMVGEIEGYPGLREKIKVVKNKDLLGEIRIKTASENNIVDAAVPDKKYLSNLPKGVKALVFEGELDVFSFRQLEGVLAALRALQQEDAQGLITIYEILTGEPFKGSERDIVKYMEDPWSLAKIIIFTLPPGVKRYEDLVELNRILLEFIRAA